MSEKKEPTSSTVKTSKTCFSMFERWKKVSGREKGTVDDYTKACIEGYPKNTKIQPAILGTRIKGVETHARLNGLKIDANDIEKARKRVSEYRESLGTRVKAKAVKTEMVDDETPKAAKPALKVVEKKEAPKKSAVKPPK